MPSKKRIIEDDDDGDDDGVEVVEDGNTKHGTKDSVITPKHALTLAHLESTMTYRELFNLETFPMMYRGVPTFVCAFQEKRPKCFIASLMKLSIGIANEYENEDNFYLTARTIFSDFDSSQVAELCRPMFSKREPLFYRHYRCMEESLDQSDDFNFDLGNYSDKQMIEEDDDGMDSDFNKSDGEGDDSSESHGDKDDGNTTSSGDGDSGSDDDNRDEDDESNSE